MKKVILLIIVSLFLFACQNAPHQNTIEDRVSINQILNTDLQFYYHKDLVNNVDCLSGNCQDQFNQKDYLVKQDCFFCNSSNVKNDSIELSIAPVFNSDLSTSCSNSDVYSYPNELEILEQSNNFIRAKGISGGTFERTGNNCENFKYEYEIEREYIFTTKNLSEGISIQAFLSNDQKNMSIPKWSNPAPSGSEYSSTFLSIECNSDVGLNVQPTFVTLQYNGVEATKTPVAEYKRDLPSNRAEISFASFDVGNYTIQGKCFVFDEGTEVVSQDFHLFVN